jgi:alcohol dehydrogenase class IV
LTSEQTVLTWDDVKALPPQETAAWVIAPLARWAASELACPVIPQDAEPEAGLRRLVVIGGGAIIDQAKLWKRDRSPGTWLCAVPSLWGSGAEASPVAVRLEAGSKAAHMAPELRPDARAICPALAESVPADAARWGYGDTFAHVVEGFLSPLATDELRGEMAGFMRDRLLPQPLTPAPEWFELSALACALQARAGVGLVHGIAHVLEPCTAGFGHARICAAFLFPVLAYNVSRGPKVPSLCGQHRLDLDQLLGRARAIFEPADFDTLLPALEAQWMSVLRHPLSRINCTVVRPNSLAYFQNREFAA